jgi:hypothetical protein
MLGDERGGWLPVGLGSGVFVLLLGPPMLGAKTGAGATEGEVIGF